MASGRARQRESPELPHDFDGYTVLQPDELARVHVRFTASTAQVPWHLQFKRRQG